jgi:MFS family permease
MSSSSATIATAVQGRGFDRWLIPPAALAVHLSIGQLYAFSVFNEPLTRAIGITASAPGDWRLTDLGWIFSLAIVTLGLTAAFAGKWLERVGPRRALLASAACFGGGFVVSAIGVHTHQIALIYLGYGVIGGFGLGLGYVTPVTVLIKWFPDRRGLAAGLAIMGFGGGALIGAPLAVALIGTFKSDVSVGVAETFMVMGLVYAIAIAAGALAIRLPAPGWKPDGWVAPPERSQQNDVSPRAALRTKAFWLLWLVLCLNVAAGIGVLGQASVLIQEVFERRVGPEAAAGFVGLLSLFNMGGRLFWSAVSDRIGRRRTYFLLLALGSALYAFAPFAGPIGGVVLFVACYALIISMFGGGFAAFPAYVADLFGTRHFATIYGRLLTAWATAGVLGPVLINYVREHQITQGVPAAYAYDVTMFILAEALALGFLCNGLITRPERANEKADADSIHRNVGGRLPAARMGDLPDRAEGDGTFPLNTERTQPCPRSVSSTSSRSSTAPSSTSTGSASSRPWSGTVAAIAASAASATSSKAAGGRCFRWSSSSRPWPTRVAGTTRTSTGRSRRCGWTRCGRMA